MRRLDPSLPDSDLWDPEFLTIARQSARSVLSAFGSGSSILADRTLRWLSLRSDIQQPEAYFTHPQSLPLLALPWWLEKAIRNHVDYDFQADLMASSIAGYYFTRMLDDLMDGHDLDRACLPALYLFHARFQSVYSRYFPLADSFWPHFERHLRATAEAASADFILQDVTEADFLRCAARKSAAAAIPLAAVCHRYQRPELLAAWEDLFVLLGRWNQMRDDLLDWSDDHNSGTRTWLLCEAERRRAPEESLPLWISRTGFSWASAIMDGWMRQMIAAAASLSSPGLSAYLHYRRASFRRQLDGMIGTAAIYERLLQLDSPLQPR